MRLIDTDAIDYKGYKLIGKSYDFIRGVEFMHERIEEAPTIDAVEVVRCIDCKHFREDTSPDGYGWCYLKRELPFCRRTIEPVMVDYNDYCSYGKRKE